MLLFLSDMLYVLLFIFVYLYVFFSKQRIVNALRLMTLKLTSVDIAVFIENLLVLKNK